MAAQTVAVAQISGIVRDDSGGVLPGVEVTVHADRHRRRADGLHQRERRLRAAQPAGGAVPPHGDPAGFQHLRAGGHRAAGADQPDHRHQAQRRHGERDGDRVGRNRDGRNPVHGRRPGDRQPAGHRDAAERPTGHRADLPLGPCHLRPRRRPQHQQELSNRHHLGRRRAGQRHDLHHGRRHPQRPVQQPQPADAVPRRAAGVQGRDERAAGAVRPPRRFGGERRHEGRHQQRFRAAPSSSCATTTSTRATRFAPAAGQAEAQPVRRRRSAGRSCANKLFFFGGYQGTIENSNPPEVVRYVPTAAMRAGDFTAFASPQCNGGRQVELRRAVRQQPPDAVAAQPGVRGDAASTCRWPTTRAAASSSASRTTATTIRLLGKVDYTFSARQTMQARYLYARYDNPATYDGQQRADAQPDRPDQLGALRRRRPQLRRDRPRCSTRSGRPSSGRSTIARCPSTSPPTELGSNISSLVPGYVGVSRHRERLHVRRAAPPIPATSTPRGSSWPTTSTWCTATTRSPSAATGSTRTSRPTTTGRPTERSPSPGRIPACPSPTS